MGATANSNSRYKPMGATAVGHPQPQPHQSSQRHKQRGRQRQYKPPPNNKRAAHTKARQRGTRELTSPKQQQKEAPAAARRPQHNQHRKQVAYMVDLYEEDDEEVWAKVLAAGPQRRPRPRQQQQQAPTTTGGGGDTNWGLLLNLHTLPRGTVGPSPTQPPQQPSRDGAYSKPKTAAGEPPADPRRRRAASSSTQPVPAQDEDITLWDGLYHTMLLSHGGAERPLTFPPELFIERGSEIHLRSYPPLRCVGRSGHGPALPQSARLSRPKAGLLQSPHQQARGGGRATRLHCGGDGVRPLPVGSHHPWQTGEVASPHHSHHSTTRLLGYRAASGDQLYAGKTEGGRRVGTGAATTQASTPILL